MKPWMGVWPGSWVRAETAKVARGRDFLATRRKIFNTVGTEEDKELHRGAQIHSGCIVRLGMESSNLFCFVDLR